MSDDNFKDPKITINRVYTKTGDAGSTRLVGGQAVSKADLRLEAYGTVDELNACLGLATSTCAELGLADLLVAMRKTQNALFNLGSILATLPEDVGPRMPRVGPRDIEWLEGQIDASTERLPTLKSFVLPGGSRLNAELHMARTICRRAERICVRLDQSGAGVDPDALKYLNRLSDALFVWSRLADVETGAEERLWAPNDA
ncbi:MAG: cob(I)yrinic acid a,c-diamide adenosyltransferase [Myxococcota bacterium]|nr:cob(I)yrinic acid a,c-diamide adenosyltransferase [Myxococcota bacterium]